VKKYEADGWYVVKIIQCNKPGFPDLMLIKDGEVFFIEVKTATGVVRPLQKYRHDELRKQGMKCCIFKGDKFIDK